MLEVKKKKLNTAITMNQMSINPITKDCLKFFLNACQKSWNTNCGFSR